ncbi:MAG: glycoside hydrolase family 130 protein [Gemmatimonadota bacterium]|nr:glycoside hydrolase family 130 protein [Gemmatimonadota bacterium]
MVLASRPDMEVVGVFNAGVTRFDGDTVLLLRVSEAPRKLTPGVVSAPIYNAETRRVEIKRWMEDTDGLDASDPRLVIAEGHTWLTSMSHLRLARSRDGVHFEVEGTPAFSPGTQYEGFGVEDPRITLLDGTYWINYTAVSRHGISTALASTTDFRTFKRHGVIFPPPNRDVTIFPEKIGGRYAALHRPMPEGLGQPSIWVATSPDLISWGNHCLVAVARPGHWDDVKIGGGAVPFRVHTRGIDAWLAVYHGVTSSPSAYSLGALLLDIHDPGKVLARSREPILAPEAVYEREGFFGDVVFTCGLITDGDLVRIYYGAADAVMAVADLSLSEILAGLSEP